MKEREIVKNVFLIGAVDWDRRLFDSLIPLPDGTSYNAYLVRGSEKTALLDTVDPTMTRVLMEQLQSVPAIDYVVAHHVEQDHSGSIPAVLEKYPQAKVLSSSKANNMLTEHLGIPAGKINVVQDGERVSLGDKHLNFVYTPWVHWPETMCTYLEEDKILFSCDFFGSHMAATDLYAENEERISEAAKRYYAEIMMPFRLPIKKHLEKLANLGIAVIAPSHGPVYNKPAFIMNAYKDWISDEPKNIALVCYVSMHGSTARMVERLVGVLAERNVKAMQFNLASADLGKLAISLVDAATVVLGTPTVLGAAHPAVAQAAFLANALRPKLRFASVIGSYGWGGRAVESLAAMLQNLKVEFLKPVLCKGLPLESDLKALDELAETIKLRHLKVTEG